MMDSLTTTIPYSCQDSPGDMPSVAAASTSQDFVVVSVDGDRVVQDQFTSEKHATSLSQLDHYAVRPRTLDFENMSLIHFV